MTQHSMAQHSMKGYALGHASASGPVAPAYAGEAKRMVYPMLSLSSEEFPPLKEWKVGETYEITCSIKMVERREAVDQIGGTFELVSAQEG